MKLEKIHWKIIAGLSLVIISVIIFQDPETEKLLTKVKKGNFRIEVNTSGELISKNFVEIKGPSSLRLLRIFQIKINNLVPEGSYVKEGDFVAQLDESNVKTKIVELKTEVEKITSKYEQEKLDTAIEMMKLRDQLINLNYDIEEKKIKVKQSTYEPPAVQRQFEIELEKSERTLQQNINSILLKRKQNEAKLYEIVLSLNQENLKLKRYEELLKSLTVLAPQDGMIVYSKYWDGTKITTGSEIGNWTNDYVVATLPDFSKMLIKTYVNEIDISNLKNGLTVDISIDAFPDKIYSGKVIDVGNIGQQLQKSESKVFEVMIEINEMDSLLRPAMTANNNILIEELSDVLFIPQESVFANDSISYVIVKTRFSLKKQKVYLGKSNSNFVVVEKGLENGEELLMVKPEDIESISWR